MEQQPWWIPIAVTVLIMPTLAGIAWAFKTFVQHAERANTLLSATNDAFIAYLKGESDRAMGTYEETSRNVSHALVR